MPSLWADGNISSKSLARPRNQARQDKIRQDKTSQSFPNSTKSHFLKTGQRIRPVGWGQQQQAIPGDSCSLNTLLGGLVFAPRETEQSHFTLQTPRRWLDWTAEPCWLLHGSNVQIPLGGFPAASVTTLRSTVASTQAAFTTPSTRLARNINGKTRNKQTLPSHDHMEVASTPTLFKELADECILPTGWRQTRVF